jgi:hypothetical protein
VFVEETTEQQVKKFIDLNVSAKDVGIDDIRRYMPKILLVLDKRGRSSLKKSW